MPLSPGFEFLALDLQEKASLSHGNIRDHLDGAVRDMAGKDGYGYVLDVFGDENEGDVVHRTNGKTFKSKYTIATSGSKRKASVGEGKPVMPRVVYDEEPKAKESETPKAAGLQLVESAATVERIVLKEAKADYEIKLIAPGKGSSAFYPAEVLKRDGPKVFKAGTHVYLNHPTAAEEAQRPEGDVKNLAGVLSTTAVFHETHAKGPGLYARMKVFADHGQMVEEKAAHVGMSIRASGNAESGKAKDGLPILKELVSAESVDVVTRAGAGGMILTESARTANDNKETTMDEKDVKALVESATKPLLDTITKLQETLDKNASPVKALEARALRGDATVEAARVLSGLSLTEAAKQHVIENVLRGDIPTKDGALDVTKFTELVTAESKRVGSLLSQAGGGGRVVGMGTSVTTEQDPVKLAEAQKLEREAREREDKDAEAVFMRFGLSEAQAKAAATHREVANA